LLATAPAPAPAGRRGRRIAGVRRADQCPALLDHDRETEPVAGHAVARAQPAPRLEAPARATLVDVHHARPRLRGRAPATPPRLRARVAHQQPVARRRQRQAEIRTAVAVLVAARIRTLDAGRAQLSRGTPRPAGPLER